MPVAVTPDEALLDWGFTAGELTALRSAGTLPPAY
jgi:hypothetical protein